MENNEIQIGIKLARRCNCARNVLEGQRLFFITTATLVSVILFPLMEKE